MMFSASTPFKNYVVSLGKYGLTAIVIVGAGVLVTRYVGAPALSINQVSTQKQTTFDVSGQAEIVTIPDQAEVYLGVTTSQTTVAAAQQQINQVINSITQEVQKMGVEEKNIKTQNYSIYPQYGQRGAGSSGVSAGNAGSAVATEIMLVAPDTSMSQVAPSQPSGDQQRIVGYTASANLVIKVTDFELLNQVMDKATSLGANQVGGVQFSISKAKQDEIEKQARQDAIADAQRKAKELAGLAGMKLGRVINVYEQSPIQPYPMYGRAEMSFDAAAPTAKTTNVQPGSQTLNYQITLSFETL